MNIRMAMVATLGAVVVALATVTASSAARDQKLQRAIDLIESKGDIADAIPLLKEVAKSSDKTEAAQALLYLGRAQEKTDKAQARQTYERIVSEFSGQPAAASQARARLAALGDGSGVASERRIVALRGELRYASLVNGDRTVLFSLPGPGSSSFLDIASGTVRHINGTGSESGGDCAFPALSPDAKQIACTWKGAGKNGKLELRLLPAAGNGAKSRTLISGGADIDYFRAIAWTHDGASLFVELEKNDRTWSLARMNVADGQYEVLKSGDRRRIFATGMRVRLSPDGRYLAYAALTTTPPPNVDFDTLDKRIYVLALEGSVETDVTPADGINENPVWTTDGLHLVFVSNRSGSFDLWAVPISKGKASGTSFIVRRNIGRGADGFAVTNTGDYFYAPAAPGISSVSIADLKPRARAATGRAEFPPIPFGTAPSWSPDGNKIAFFRPTPGGGSERDLLIRTLATGMSGATRLPPARGWRRSCGSTTAKPRWCA